VAGKVGGGTIVRKLHPNSHLYTSDTFIENFPGRIFRIVNQCSFNKKEVKENLADLKTRICQCLVLALHIPICVPMK